MALGLTQLLPKMSNKTGKVSPLEARCVPEDGKMYRSNLPCLRHYKEVRGQRHAPAALYPVERLSTHFTGGCFSLMAGLHGRKTCPHRDSISNLSEMSTRSIYFCKEGRFEGLTKLTNFKCRLSSNVGASNSWSRRDFSRATMVLLLF